VGFFTPYAFFFLSLLGPIIWFYLWREKKHVIPVSSIIPWRQLSMGQSPEDKAFHVDWQLILQLLIIILATLALARLYWLRSVSLNHQVIIVDTSASMSARDKQGVTRLELARGKALELINRAGPQTRLSLIEMAANAKHVQDFTDNKPALRKRVKEISPKEEGTNFQAALNLARSFLRGYAGGQIHLITDSEQWLLDNLELRQQLSIIKVGQSAENLAITGLDAYQGLYAEQEQTVYIRLVNSSARARKTWLKVSLDGRLLKRKRLNLLPHSHQNFPLKLRNKKGVLKVELEAEDALAADNAAYLLLKKRQPLPVLLVTPSDAMEEDFARLAAATGRINYSRILPEQFDSGLLAGYRLVIFHQSAPTKHFPIHSFLIDAPPGHGLWKTLRQPIAQPQILDWDRRHPSLKYLDFLDKLVIEQAQDVRLPGWGNLLIGTPQLPLAFWGEERGFKQLVFCFDLQPLLFPDSQDVSGIILLLNCLDWLASSAYKGERLKTGEPYLLSSPRPLKEVVVTNPRGEEERFTPQKAKFHYDRTNYVGVYRVRTLDVEGNKIQSTFVANLLDESEANLVLEERRQVQKQEGQKVAALKLRQEPHELWRVLLLCAALCLLGEWWLYLRE